MSKTFHFWIEGLTGVACRTEIAADKWPATFMTKYVTCKRCIATSVYRKWK